MVPGEVIELDVVVGVFTVVDAVDAGVDVVVDGTGGVADAGADGGFGVGRPERDVVTSGEAELNEPLVGELDGGYGSGLGDGRGDVDEGVAEHVVERRDLGLDAGEGGEAADADVHAFGHVGDIEVEVVEGGVVAVLLVVHEELIGEGSFFNVEAVVGAKEVGEVEAPVYVIALDGVGQAFDDEYSAIEGEAVWVDVIGDWVVGIAGGAEGDGGTDPAHELDAGQALGVVADDGGHEGVAVGVGGSEVGGAAVGPVGGGEGRRV